MYILKIAIGTLISVTIFCNCNAQSSKDSVGYVPTTLEVAPESLHFTAYVTETYKDGSRAEIDTVTGYRKYYYSNGKLQMEGKVTKGNPKDYRDGIWKYYNEEQELMTQETYDKNGKVNHREFRYFDNGKPMTEEYQYFEGNYKDKASFKFHKIEKMFYTNGQELSERHLINDKVIEIKCWDSKGNPKPVEYLDTIKSLQVDE